MASIHASIFNRDHFLSTACPNVINLLQRLPLHRPSLPCPAPQTCRLPLSSLSSARPLGIPEFACRGFTHYDFIYDPFFSYNMDAKHASLMQDYDLIQQEFTAVKDRLQVLKSKNATLSAEVRFLRRRLKELKTNSQTFLSSVSSLPAKNPPRRNGPDRFPLSRDNPALVGSLKTSALRSNMNAIVAATVEKRKISSKYQNSEFFGM